MAGNNAAVLRRPRGLLQAFTEKLGPALVAIGGSTAVTAITVRGEPESSLPVSSSRRALWARAAMGVAALWAGIFVAAGGPRRHRIGLVFLGAALMLVSYSVRAGDFDPELLAAIFYALA